MLSSDHVISLVILPQERVLHLYLALFIEYKPENYSAVQLLKSGQFPVA